MSNAEKFISVGYRKELVDGKIITNVGAAVPERCDDIGLDDSGLVVKSSGTFRKTSESGLELEQVSDAPDFWNDEKIMKDVKLAFIAIPSSEDERELEVIEALHEKGVRVVTAAKGALANHFERLEPIHHHLGISATVGGNSRPLPFLADRMNARINQVHGVVNGTINYFLHGVDQGDTAGQIIDQAVVLKYAEPGAESHLDVLNGEVVGDIPKKTSILWNVALRPFIDPSEILVPGDIKQPGLTQEDLGEIIANASDLRYILSIIRMEDEIPEKEVIAGFRKEIDAGWVVIGGFRKISSNPLFKRHLNLPGAWNGLVIAGGPNESDGIASTAAPGAGPGPTAASMVQDARILLKQVA